MLRCLALESRLPLEMITSVPLGFALPRHRSGDPVRPRPVLVVPGFVQNDSSVAGLHWYLRRLGLRTYGWKLGRNMGPTAEVWDGMQRRLESIAGEFDTAVSIVGTSLGGCFARELARANPKLVRELVMLGSPFRANESSASGPAMMAWRALRKRFDDDTLERLLKAGEEREPLCTPSSAVYSRSDGMVAWADCLEMPGPIHENIEVRSSHIGLSWNAAAQFVVGDRLSQPDGHWRPFVPPQRIRRLYPGFSGEASYAAS